MGLRTPCEIASPVAGGAGSIAERRPVVFRWLYNRCGSIEIEAGRSLPTKIGRMTCD
jgi:hypothetical protein